MDVTAETLHAGLLAADYVATPRVETALELAPRLEKPFLVEGPSGAGKTELAKVLASTLGTRLIRLQCYEGLDEARALFEWNYQKQLLRIHADRASGATWESIAGEIFDRDYLLARPLLQAILAPSPVVLLIDEIDKADPEFEAFLLELLSDWQVSVPELGTLRAEATPVVVLTSNRTRDLYGSRVVGKGAAPSDKGRSVNHEPNKAFEFPIPPARSPRGVRRSSRDCCRPRPSRRSPSCSSRASRSRVGCPPARVPSASRSS